MPPTLVDLSSTGPDRPTVMFWGEKVPDLALLAEVPAVCIDVSARVAEHGPAIDLNRLAELDFEGVAVVVRTGWSGDDAATMPYLTPESARSIHSGGAAVFAIDTPPPTRPRDEGIECLLQRGIPVVVSVSNLAALPVVGFCLGIGGDARLFRACDCERVTVSGLLYPNRWIPHA